MKDLILLCGIVYLIGFCNCSSPDFSDTNERKETIESMTPEKREVFDLLLKKDSLLFGVGFNSCDTTIIKRLTSEDFEFYHDQAGITDSQEAFAESIAGLCNMTYKATRELVPNSMDLHLLKNNGVLYGAIQSGKHHFYGKEANKPKQLTSSAEFIHLWILKDKEWKLKRVLSFDHH